MPTYTYLEAAVVTQIERERAIQLDEQSVLAQIMPMTDENTDSVMWDLRGNVKGLLPYGDRNNPFPQLTNESIERFPMTPGHFHGTKRLDADRIARGGTPGTLGDVINVDAEVAICQLELQQMLASTRDAVRGQLLALGYVSVADKDGVLHRIASYGDYNSRYAALTGGDKWDAPTTATPFKNLRAWYSYFEGTGHIYGPQARFIVNKRTANVMLACDEIRTYKDKYGATIDAVNSLNEKIDREGDLPLIEAIQDGYLDSSGNFQPFIPVGYGILVGYHPFNGLKAGNIVNTRNSDKLGEVGIYAETDTNPDPPKLPRTHLSASFGPRINYHKQIQVIKLY